MSGAVTLAAVLGLAACGQAKEADTGAPPSGTGAAGGSVDEGFKIGLLLPETKTARYEKFDRPYITQSIATLCPKCQVIYNNANQDPNLQQQQVDSMLTNGVKVLILDAVDAKAIASAVTKANSQG